MRLMVTKRNARHLKCRIFISKEGDRSILVQNALYFLNEKCSTWNLLTLRRIHSVYVCMYVFYRADCKF